MKADAHLSPVPPGRPEVLCFKSWTAYVRPTVIAAIAVPLAILALAPLQSIHLTFAAVIVILAAYAASVLRLQEEMLMLDDEGVWYCRGGLGTKPRVVGVRWCHVRCSLAKPRMRWPRTSSTVIVRNRVTSREIVINHMARGDLAVARVSSLQQRRPQDAR